MKFTDHEQSPNAQAAAKSVAETGTHVPEKLFSPEAKIEAAAGPQAVIAPCTFKSGKEPHGYGHTARSGNLRCSGHSGAHQIGKKK